HDAVRLADAAELDPRVPAADLDLGLEHEVRVGLVGHEELVLLEVPLGPPDDLAVLDGEQVLVVGGDPPRQVLAVEQGLEVALLGGRHGVGQRQAGGQAEAGSSHRGSPERWWMSMSHDGPSSSPPWGSILPSTGGTVNLPEGAAPRFLGPVDWR